MKVREKRETIKENPLDVLDEIEGVNENKFPLTKGNLNDIKPILNDEFPESFIEEMNRIMKYLGRKITEGDVRGTHLGKVLFYLMMNQTEPYDDTQYKLALMLGVSPRIIRENYLKGFEKCKIIYVFLNNNGEQCWEWRGLKV